MDRLRTPNSELTMMTMTQINGYKHQHLDSPKTAKIKISIVDNSVVIREGLKVMLKTEANFDIVGAAEDAPSAIKLIEQQQPDIVLMDIEMPQLNGINTTQIICEQFADTKVIIYSSHTENSYITQSLEAGAKGYFLKQTPIEELVQGIKNVYKGFCQFSPGLLENYVNHTSLLKAQVDDLAPSTTEANDTHLITNKSESQEIDNPLPEAIISQPKKSPWRILVWSTIAIATLVLAGLASAKFRPELYGQINNTPPPPVPTPPPVPEPVAVSALGQIEPEGEVIQLSVSSAAEGSRVEQLLVKQGDTVRRGQIIAVLDNYSRRLAALENAKADVQIAQANLARVKAGARQGDINAQQATINRLEAELRGQIAAQEAAIARLNAELANARIEYRRYEQLYQDGAISASDRDTRLLRVDTVKEQLAEAQETLNRTVETTKVQRKEAQAKLASIAEVRPVDVQVAQAELTQRMAAVKQAQAALELTEVRSPMNGQVLTVNVRPGEVVGNRGIVALGQTDQMYVVAEVYETDIDKVRLGQTATVTGAAFTEELTGKVAEVGLEVQQQDVFEADPLVDTDNRVVEVKIRLDPESSQRVRSLSNLQVQVVIKL